MTWAKRLKRVFNIDIPQDTLSFRRAGIQFNSMQPARKPLKKLVRRSAFYSSAMDRCEVFDDWRREYFRLIRPLFAIFSGPMIRIHEKICSREAPYLTYT